MKRAILLILAGVLICMSFLFALYGIYGYLSSWSLKDQIEHADTLLKNGLKNDAAQVMENYIQNSRLGKAQLARACFKLGQIYAAVSEPKKALRYFYKARILDKKGEFAKEVDEKIAEALKGAGAEEDMHDAALIGQNLKKGEVIATIGNNIIYMQDLEEALSIVPDEVRKDLEADPQAKLQFIKDYVASQALYYRAKRMGLDKEGPAREYLNTIEKQFLIQQLLEREIKKDINITEDELMEYYRLNIDKFQQPSQIKVSYVEIPDYSKRDWTIGMIKREAINRFDNGKGIYVEEWVSENDDSIGSLGQSKDTVAKLFLLNKGDYSDMAVLSGKSYIFWIMDKAPRAKKDFDDVKKDIENELIMKKQDDIINSVLNEALEKDAKILYEPKK